MKTKFLSASLKMICVALACASLLLTGIACSKDGEFSEAETPPAMKTTPAQQAPATQPAQGAGSAAGYNGKVVETMDAGGYTYVHVDTGKEKVWAAAPLFKVAVGDEASFAAAMPMRNFSSNTLDRTFDVVYFVSHVTLGDAASAEATPHEHAVAPSPQQAPGAPKLSDAGVSGIEKADGGFTVAEIYAGKGALSGSEVVVRGKVVKFNGGIMGRNWLHIQDGTGGSGTNDLTVTSQEAARVGETVLVRGTLVTDQDFGSGYRYELIVEKASITVQ